MRAALAPALLLLAALAAWPAAAQEAPEPRVVELRVHESGCPGERDPCFDAPLVRAEPGERLRFVLVLDGQMPHRLRVAGNGVDASAPHAAFEGNQTLDAIMPPEGEGLEAYCEVHPTTMSAHVSSEPESILTGALRAEIEWRHVDALTVEATGVGGEAAVRLAWDWGDGNVSEGTPARHAYARGGEWTVVLTAFDADGNALARRAVVETFDAHRPFVASISPRTDACPDAAPCWSRPEILVPFGAPVSLDVLHDAGDETHRLRVLASPPVESGPIAPGARLRLAAGEVRAGVPFECAIHPSMKGVLRPESAPVTLAPAPSPEPGPAGGAERAPGAEDRPAPLPPLALLLVLVAAAAALARRR